MNSIRKPTPEDIRQEIADGFLVLHACPVCGAAEGEPCRTPKGRKKDDIHDTRPFSIGGLFTKTGGLL